MKTTETVESKTSVHSYLDDAWKEALRLYFKNFTELCWPEAYQGIAWNKGYELLEQEFQAIVKREEIGNRITDKLIKTWRNDGNEQWILIHIEIQANWIAHLPERMFTYRYRIFDRYQKDIASLAILIDDNPNWRPNIYEKSLWGSSIKMEYPVLKLLDYKTKKDILEISDNPFALVILVQLMALETTKNKEARLISKIGLTKKLFQHGWNNEQILSLYRFLDGIMRLPQELTLEYTGKVKEMVAEDPKMSYLTTLEQIAIEKGLEQGIAQGLEQGIQRGESILLQNLLKAKFKNIPEHYLTILEKADPATLLQWGQKLLKADTIQQVFEE